MFMLNALVKGFQDALHTASKAWAASTVAYVKGCSPSVLRAVTIPEAYSSSTASCSASLGEDLGICLLPWLAHRPSFWLPRLAHGRFHRLIRRVSWLGRIAQRVELAHLMGDLRPERLHRQEFADLWHR